MTAVLRFALLYAIALAILAGLARSGLGAWLPMVQPALTILAAWGSTAVGVAAVFQLLAVLVVLNLSVTLGLVGLAGHNVIPGLVSEFMGAPVLLTLWMLSSLILPGLLIAAGVWLRHITHEIRRRRQ